MICRGVFQLSRPHGAVITKRNRGPRPVRRGFGQLHGWLEVAEPAGWRLTDRRPTFQFAGDELGWYTLNRRRRHFTEINDPLAHLNERDPYQPAGKSAQGQNAKSALKASREQTFQSHAAAVEALNSPRGVD